MFQTCTTQLAKAGRPRNTQQLQQSIAIACVAQITVSSAGSLCAYIKRGCSAASSLLLLLSNQQGGPAGQQPATAIMTT
jgi:hypothetical protein